MQILYGALGALFVLAIFAGGFASGWVANNKVRQNLVRAKAEEATEEEKRKLMQEQTAFHSILNYSPEMAYGELSERGDES